MGKLIIEAAAVLNEDNKEFFAELMKKGVDAVAPEMKKQLDIRDREKVKEQLPNITEDQLDILDFWRIRGYEDVSHCLGMSIDLKRKDRFRSLGLDLTYLEQFQKEAKQSALQEIGEYLNSIEDREDFKELKPLGVITLALMEIERIKQGSDVVEKKGDGGSDGTK